MKKKCQPMKFNINYLALATNDIIFYTGIGIILSQLLYLHVHDLGTDLIVTPFFGYS